MNPQQTSITHSALGWVKKSIDDNLVEIKTDLKQYIEDEDEALLAKVKERLGVIQGVLTMIEQYGASMLTEEMVALADYIMEHKQQQGEQALEIMLRAVLQLPDYLEHIQSGHRDIPIAILPLLNDIRAVRNQDLFSEKLLFLPDLSMHQEGAEAESISEEQNHASKLLTKKIRPIYQVSLLNVIKDKSLDESLKRLEKICETLEERSFSEQIARIWWIVGALIESVSRQQLELGVSIKNLLGKVDALFRVILIIGERGLVKRQPIELIKNFLYYIAQPECDGPKAQAIKTAYRLEQFLPSESARSEMLNNIAGPNQALLKTVAETMKADIEAIKSTLEVYVNGDLSKVEALKDLPQEMHVISDTLAMIGLGSQRQLIAAQIETVKQILSGNQPAGEEQLLSMAAELLQVEQALDQMQKRQLTPAEEPRSDGDVSRDYELDNVLTAVVTAALDDIQKTKNAILEFIKDSSREDNIELCVTMMEESRGALALLNEPRAVAVVDGLLDYLRGYDIVEFMEASRLDALSQVVVSLEYYLEALGEHRGDADSILDFADVQLQELLSNVKLNSVAGDEPELVIVDDDEDDIEAEVPSAAEDIPPQPEVIEFKAPAAHAPSDDVPQDAIVAAEISVPDTGSVEIDESETTVEPDTIQAVLDETQQDLQIDASQSATQGEPAEAKVKPEEKIKIVPVDEELEVLKPDSDPEILEIYLEEAEEEAQNIQRLQQDWLLHPEDENALKNIRRAFHTIKGSGRLVGAMKIGEFAWDFEQLLNRVIDKTVSPDTRVIDAVGKAAKTLPKLVDELKSPNSPQTDIGYLRGLAKTLAEFNAEQVLFEHTQQMRKVESPYDRITDDDDDDDEEGDKWDEIDISAETQSTRTNQNKNPLLEEIEPDTMRVDPASLQLPAEGDDAKVTDIRSYDDTVLEQLQKKGEADRANAKPVVSEDTADKRGDYTHAIDYARDATSPQAEAIEAIELDDIEPVPREAILIETVGEDFLGDDFEDEDGDNPSFVDSANAEYEDVNDGVDEASADDLAFAEEYLAPDAVSAPATAAEIIVPEVDAGAESAAPGAFLTPALNAEQEAADAAAIGVSDAIFETEITADEAVDSADFSAEPAAAEALENFATEALSAVETAVAEEIVAPDEISELEPAEADEIVAPDAIFAAETRVDDEIVVPDVAADAVTSEDEELYLSAETSTPKTAATDDIIDFDALRAQEIPAEAEAASDPAVFESPPSTADSVQEIPPDPFVDMTRNRGHGDVASATQAPVPGAVKPTALSFDPELLIIYQQEVEQHLSIVSSALDRAEQIHELNPSEEFYRALHTIHGASRTADISTIGELAGLMEKPLKTAIAQGRALDGEIAALYREGQYALQAMLDELVATRELPPIPPDLENSLQALAEDLEEHTVEIPDEEQLVTTEFVDTLTMMNEAADAEQDDELLHIFIDEANELLEMSDNTLEEWAQQGADGQDFGAVMELQRYLHTLKGGARMAELKEIGDLSHELESMFIAVIDGRVDKHENLLNLLRNCFDLLHRQVVQAQQGQPMSDSSSQVDSLRGMRTGGADAVAEEAVDEVIEDDSEDINIVDEILSGEPMTGLDRPGQDVIKVRSDLLDNLVSSAGEVSIYRARMEQQVAGLGSHLGELGQTIARLKGQLRTLEAETDAQIHFSHRESSQSSEFDPLEMDRYTMIQELSRSLSESVNDLASLQAMLGDQVKDSETLLLQQSRINTDLQDGLIKSRMVKFSGLLSRLRRLVRQSGQELGKKAELVVTGEDNEVDNKVLDRMVAPLEHIIRNALSHGIETPVERVRKGKPENGKISIDIIRDGSDIVIRVSDDGAGVNLDKVRSRAIQLGLLDESKQVSDHDLVQYILEPGFSTADQVTQLAGRGVGMDVVDIEIKQLGGVLQIETTPQGTIFIARLPFTLSINQAILVRSDDETYAIPLINIEGITRLEAATLLDYYRQPKPEIEYAGQKFALHNLGKLVNSGTQFRPTSEQEKQPVILGRSGDVRVALHVDEIMGNREIVVKTLGKQLSQVKGLAGASILADGSVVLILDINGLMRQSAASAVRVVYPTDEAGDAENRDTVMVVDDSITMRRVASKLLERHNYEVVTAKDGVDALAQLQDVRPDVMLLDIEMPRMDGFELATHMQNEESYSRIPIIMITSRTGEKHRDRALEIGVTNYMGKPYQEEELIENIQNALGVR